MNMSPRMTMRQRMLEAECDPIKAEMFVVSMAMDAFRLSMGMKPQNFRKLDVLRWINAIAKVRLAP